jgi:hypothetical protein
MVFWIAGPCQKAGTNDLGGQMIDLLTIRHFSGKQLKPTCLPLKTALQSCYPAARAEKTIPKGHWQMRQVGCLLIVVIRH